MVNSMVVSGNVCADPRKFGTEEHPGIGFTLAMNVRVKDGSEWVDYTMYISCAMFDNVMFGSSKRNVRKKPGDARYLWGIVYNGTCFGLWRSGKGDVYVSSKVPNGGDLYVVSTYDAGVGASIVRRTSPMLGALSDYYFADRLYYESPSLRGIVEQVLSYLGIR